MRSFSIPLDDISADSFNCYEDSSTYSSQAQGQAAFLNDINTRFIKAKGDIKPLQMVPTDYSGTSSSSYKSTLGANLQADIMIGWTGPEVTPPDITVSHMSTANSFFGRKLFIWDNFPCNDYGPTASRLLMGAYQTRQSGLSNVINGLVSNPMNQAAASKPALTGVAAFAWNDLNYNKTTAWNWGMAWMAKGNPQLTADLQVFGDLNFAWPYSNTFVVPQSPTLRSLATGFAASPAGSDLTALTAYADSMANGTGRIRTQLGDPIFISDADPWQHAIAAVVAARAGDTALVTTETTAAKSARTTAQAVRITNKQNRWSETATPAPKLGDGVLDVLINDLLAKAATNLTGGPTGGVDGINYAAGATSITASSVDQ